MGHRLVHCWCFKCNSRMRLVNATSRYLIAHRNTFMYVILYGKCCQALGHRISYFWLGATCHRCNTIQSHDEKQRAPLKTTCRLLWCSCRQIIIHPMKLNSDCEADPKSIPIPEVLCEASVDTTPCMLLRKTTRFNQVYRRATIDTEVFLSVERSFRCAWNSSSQ